MQHYQVFGGNFYIFLPIYTQPHGHRFVIALLDFDGDHRFTADDEGPQIESVRADGIENKAI